ncbi:tetratricopeptide repeat protein [Sulfurimonas sp.]|uniref:tetratricopeptide repeat protein n=1 Tax=Sulfurimonas sp. TaxID=2022749 RepID=UPI003D0B5C2C
MYKTIKLLLSTLLILTLNTHAETTKALEYSKPPYDQRLNDYPRAKSWYQMANDDSAAAYNIGLIYQDHIKDYKKAEIWYKKAWSIKNDKDIAFNMGHLYNYTFQDYKNAVIWYQRSYKLGEKEAAFSLALLYKKQLKDYEKAIKWYTIADKMGQSNAANNLGYLYDKTLGDYPNAILWYKKGVKNKNSLAIKNIASLYHKRGDNITAVAYFISLITLNSKYEKEKVLKYMSTKWKIDNITIKKGYELQLNSNIIPEELKYKGGI